MDNNNWSTHYFGRFQIALPKESEISQIAGHPETYISLLTKGIVKKEPNLLQRFDDKHYDHSISDLANSGKINLLRKRNRSVGGIHGEEVAVSATFDGKTFYAFQFEYEGTLESNTRPYIAIELGTHEQGTHFQSDDQALAFWDHVLQSFKPLSE
ncbi:T6SS immunity protein Tli4 family protein [Pseudomonas faucium]|uniref:T6SS immunity protein Tli4 family protein n=1 Tax=Pseudomonas faucium TaxID=2740518 RepID=UPI001EEAB2EE|nr:T6SS immunity protein Tli4 family protein [Pseudomonas faucium]